MDDAPEVDAPVDGDSRNGGGRAVIASPAHAPVEDGWSAHRQQVRRLGPLAALIPPLATGATSLAMLAGTPPWWRGVASVMLAVAAAPLMAVTGVPATVTGVRLSLGIGASAALWLILGAVAARRATRTPGASWPEWRRDYRHLAIGAVVGGWAGVVIAGLVVGARLW